LRMNGKAMRNGKTIRTGKGAPNGKGTLKIPKIERGVVIDHIPQGLGLAVLHVLGGDHSEKNFVSIGLNYPSKKLGRKDLVKIEDFEITEDVLRRVALVAPGASVKIIKDFGVVGRVKMVPPDIVLDLIQCKNPNCITNVESGVSTTFYRVSNGKMSCRHCERAFPLAELRIKAPTGA
jgi:aspartate carbamoyltransferase regulatory subunit